MNPLQYLAQAKVGEDWESLSHEDCRLSVGGINVALYV